MYVCIGYVTRLDFENNVYKIIYCTYSEDQYWFYYHDTNIIIQTYKYTV